MLTNGRFSYYITCILDDQDKNFFDAASNNISNKLLILSKHVDVWPIGDLYEPIRILVKYFDEQYNVTEMSYTFAKCTLVKDLKEILSNDYWANRSCSHAQLQLTLIRSSNKVESQQLLTVYEDSKSLADMSANNGDFITIEECISMAQMTSKRNTQSNQPISIVKSTIESLSSAKENPRLVKMNDITVINCMHSPGKNKRFIKRNLTW